MTKLSITLDKSEYEQQLAKVITDTRSAAADMSAAVNQPKTVKVDADTSEVKKAIDEIPEAPDQQITVTADTAPAEKAIDEIPEAPDQQITVTADTAPAAGAIKSLGGGSIWSKMGSQFKAGASAITAIGAAAGASVPAVGMLGTVINAALSPIALISGALTALVALGTHVWDKLTVSVAEYAAKSQLASEAANRELEKFKELDTAAGSYLSRLRELSSADQQGNASKAETALLLETLQDRYGDLGAKIDETTGKILNMSEVEDRLNAKRNRQAAQKYLASADASMNEAKAAYMKAAGQGYWGERRAGRKFDEAAKSMSPEQLQKYMENRAKNGATEAEIKNYSEVANHLRKANEAREKARNMLGSGQESGIKAEQETARKAQAATSAKQARDAAAKQFAERKSDDEFAQEKDPEKRKANRQARLDAEQRNEANLQKEAADARARLENIQKDKGKPGYNAGAEADAAKAVADAERKVQESQAKQYGFKQQIQQIDKQRNEEAQKMADQSAFELEYNRLIAAGEYDKAAALKLEHELKQKNLKLTEAEKQAILDNQKAQKALNFQISNRDSLQDLKWKYMEKSGQAKEASEQRAFRDAEQRKGGKLTDSERDATKKLFELSWNLQNMRDQQFGDLSIKTNSLTARGGFQGAAAVPDTDKYNRSIDQTNKSMLNILQRIDARLSNANKF